MVGSQGRRGILPSVPGRAAVTNGVNGTAKNTTIPAKDADGKFPCPHCNKTYLHAKHLKRHLLRRELSFKSALPQAKKTPLFSYDDVYTNVFSSDQTPEIAHTCAFCARTRSREVIS